MTKKSTKPTQRIPKTIIVAGRILSLVSTKLTVLFAARLFTSPIKYKIPKREIEMDRASRQKVVHIQNINRNVVVYQYGESTKKILLVHGWSGRGTQLVKFADALLADGFSTVSFDAPAHGKSLYRTTLMPEFIESILQIEKDFGPFEGAVGHSLGGMSLMNAMKQSLKISRLVIIGSGDTVKDIIDNFILQLQMKPKIGDLMRIHFEQKYGQTMDSFSSYIAAKEIEIPVLVIHDECDTDVNVKCAFHIHKHLKNGELFITNGLGHRKILGDEDIIAKCINFIKKPVGCNYLRENI